MEALESLVRQVQAGNLDAYGAIVRRFQDMALGYAYSILGDFQLAEDAAQEAFLEAYLTLSQLRDPDAFSGWFRPIVRKHCNRLTRKKGIETVPLEAAVDLAAEGKSVEEGMEVRELRDSVIAAIQRLPENQRIVTTLFYIDGYSQNEIADFLEIPTTTIKKRLQYARKRLKERLITMAKDTLHQQRPSRNQKFTRKVTDMTGESQLRAKLKADIQRLQKTDTHVLVIGETGTGKELIGRMIHAGRPRANGPFIAVNCSALPADFDARGKVEPASSGTLFLDAIDQVPLEVQDQLVCLLNDDRVDVRVVAATNVNLEEKVTEGAFRRALYSRLAESTIFAPTLRDCREDIPLLVDHFTTQMGVKNPPLSDDALAVLESYPFPENVRELRQIIERAVKESGGGMIQPEHLHFLQSQPL